MEQTACPQEGDPVNRYVAFLRGINVGGHKPVKMEELRKWLEAAEFRNVSTFKASGNVLFDFQGVSSEIARQRIERVFRSSLGYEVQAILRELSHIVGMVKSGPFRKIALSDAVPYVTFLSKDSGQKIPLPSKSSRGDVEIFGVKDGNVYSLARKVGDRYGFPNSLAESLFGVPATTRNWKTVVGISEMESPET
jgi:uncharacterized protein (DUF1697 family)